MMSKLVWFTARGSTPDGPLPGGDRQVVDRVSQLVGLIAMSPQFHMR
jgi:hypothetical protein